MSAHTPGPWECSTFSANSVVHAGAEQIAHVFDERVNLSPTDARARRDANARLIAAAPDLLAFAERYIGSQDPCIRGDGTCTGDNGCVACELNAEVRAVLAKVRGAR